MKNPGARHTWHDDVFFGIHYDQHARADDTVLGAEMSVEHLLERLGRVRPDWVQCDCKGHVGWTSWPTSVGSTSPGVMKDSLAIYREATRQLGIRLGMHYSGVWDSRALQLHPDWARLDAEGHPATDMTCPLSPYTAELMIPQMIEIIDRYDIDGFWVDGDNWDSRPCWCPRCRGAYESPGRVVPEAPTDPGWAEWLAFHRQLFVDHVRAYADAVHARKSDCLICSNWMYSVRQPDAVEAPVDYLSGDFTWAWGADRAAAEARMLDGQGRGWDLMAWGFTKAGSRRPSESQLPWVVKPALQLQQEVSEVLGQGGSIMVYNQPQRTGWLTGWHQDVIGEVAEFCRARRSVCFQTETASQAAVLHLAGHYYAHNDPLFNIGDATEPMEGALHALLETHRSTDILTEAGALERLDRYRLIVVPEQTNLDARLVDRLAGYAEGGGHVILSGAHLAAEVPDLVGVDAEPEATENVVYLPSGKRAVGVFGPWQPVKVRRGTKVACRWLSQQEPEKDETPHPAVTRRRVGRGAVIAVHGPLFRNYFAGHYPSLRDVIDDLVEDLGLPWEVTLEGPPTAEMVARRRGGTLLINLINRGAEETLSPTRSIVTGIMPIPHLTLRVRRDQAPKSITVVPESTRVSWWYEDGEVRVDIDQLAVHRVVVIE